MEEEINVKKLTGKIAVSQNLTGNLRENSLTGTTQPITIKNEKNYNNLINKPQINEVELVANKQLEDLNVTRLTNSEIENIIDSIII